MTHTSFEQSVKNHPDLVFFRPMEGDLYFVQNRNDQRFVVEEIDVGWDEMEAFLLGTRAANIMEWTSRICGYYSNLKSWNRSKLAELEDRHKGDYDVQ